MCMMAVRSPGLNSPVHRTTVIHVHMLIGMFTNR